MKRKSMLYQGQWKRCSARWVGGGEVGGAKNLQKGTYVNLYTKYLTSHPAAQNIFFRFL